MTLFSKVNSALLFLLALAPCPSSVPGKVTPSDVSAAAMGAATHQPVTNKTNTAADKIGIAFMGGLSLVD